MIWALHRSPNRTAFEPSRLENLGLIPAGEYYARALGGQLTIRHAYYNAELHLMTCGPKLEPPSTLANRRNTWSTEKLTGAQGQYEVQIDGQEVVIQVAVYELGEATPREGYPFGDYPEGVLTERVTNCYPVFASTSRPEPETITGALDTLSGLGKYLASGDLVLPAPEVEDVSAFYTFGRGNLDTLAKTLPGDTPLMDTPLKGWVQGNAFWVVDSRFVVALAVWAPTVESATLAESFESCHLGELVNLTNGHVRALGTGAIKAPGASQTAVPAPPEWTFDTK
jgi:hypothetical protein